MAASVLLSITGATRRFRTPEGGSVHALDAVDLDVRGNEFLTLLGPSGCGKTTLLKAIAGFEDLDAGDIRLDGASLRDVPAHRRPFNTVFQSYALFPHLSVADNVGYGLDVARVPRAERDRRVAEALARVGLEAMGRRAPRQLSGGQQQRVALARALVNRPRLLLLDEPLSALDRHLRQAMQGELKALQHDVGITFLVVTHDQEEALAMSDRIAVMHAGRVRQLGTPAEIYDTPVDRFVAGFVGASNLVRGTWRSTAHGGGCVTTPAGIDIHAEGVASIANGATVDALLRPEQLSPIADGAGAAGPTLAATVASTVFVGPDVHLHAHLADGTPLQALLRHARGQALPFAVGARVVLAYRPAAVHVIAAQAT
ncbi:MAG: ABC transporter ATP-binding protein [Burkholderiales bacterium]|jgi:spermidine/putrescine transport system ATP-binding protein|nr:ABC transporter ATP-binding protein [Burkholderiales bacterium]